MGGLWLWCGVWLGERGVVVRLEVHEDLSYAATDVRREEGDLVAPRPTDAVDFFLCSRS